MLLASCDLGYGLHAELELIKHIHPKRPKPHSEVQNPFAGVYGQVLNPPSGAFWVDPGVLAGVNSRYSPQTQGLCKAGALKIKIGFNSSSKFYSRGCGKGLCFALCDSSGETP